MRYIARDDCDTNITISKIVRRQRRDRPVATGKMDKRRSSEMRLLRHRPTLAAL